MKTPNDTSDRLSRAEIETLCVLHAVGRSGCPAGQLADRLGLSVSLASVVAGAMQGLILDGLLERVDERFFLTVRGRELLTMRLAALGLG